MFMFMRKFRKNFKGDSLIEVITAFAIVSIVGLITVSGVVTSGRIKVQTNHIKNASYIADEALQEQSMYENMASDSVKIYNAADYNISTKSANTGSSPILTKSASKFSASGTDGDRTQGYKYYKMGVTGNTPSDDDGSSGGKGNFGMSGQWFVRFYLDPTVILPDRFYVELRLSGGLPGASGTIDAQKTQCTAGGVGYFNDQSGNNKSVGWFYGTNSGEYIRTGGEGLSIIDSDRNISKYTDGRNVSFDSDGNLSFAWKYDKTPTENMKNNSINAFTDFQIFDVAFYWSSLTAYNISLHIVNADTGNECYASDGSSVMDRFTVYARDFGVGIASGVYDHTKDTTKNWFTPWGKNPYGFTSNDIQCSYQDASGNWKLYKDADGKTIPNFTDTAKYQMGKQENGHNAIYNFDNIDYIYQWTKGHSGAESTENWEESFSNVNKRYMLSLGEFGTNKGENAFADGTTKFKEYIRLNAEQYYKDFINWQTSMGFSTNFENMSDGDENKFYYTYWVYYVLEIEKIRTSPNAALGDASETQIPTGINSYYDYTFRTFDDNGTCSDEIAKVFYWYKYDQNFYSTASQFLNEKSLNFSQVRKETYELNRYIDILSMYYYTDVLNKVYNKPYGSSFSDFTSLYKQIQIDNVDSSTKQAYKDVYNYFYNGENQIQQRITNYNSFVNDTYTAEQKTHLQNAFDTIKSMVESDAVKYANAKCSEDYLVKEMIIYVYNPSKYNEISEQLKSSQQGIDMTLNTRFDTQVYKDNFPDKWNAYSQSVLDSQ